MTNRVIILNGVSSAGKSTLARAIQEEASSTFLHIEMDAFISFLPNGHELKSRWFKVEKVATEYGVLPGITNGPQGNTLLSVMRGFVIDAAEKGLDLVVDEVCHAPEIANYRAGLRNCTMQVVKVSAPIEVIEEREKARGDRLIGLARQQSLHLHEDVVYDTEIDTSTTGPRELAARLLKGIGRLV